MKGKKEALELWKRTLETRECQLWPHCSCRNTLLHWQDSLRDEDRLWDPQVLERAEMVIFFSLACCARFCPDPMMKAYAKGQLAKSFWQRQKSQCIWVEP